MNKNFSKERKNKKWNRIAIFVGIFRMYEQKKRKDRSKIVLSADNPHSRLGVTIRTLQTRSATEQKAKWNKSLYRETSFTMLIRPWSVLQWTKSGRSSWFAISYVKMRYSIINSTHTYINITNIHTYIYAGIGDIRTYSFKYILVFILKYVRLRIKSLW